MQTPKGNISSPHAVSVHIDMVSYNTDLIKLSALTSYWDILSPKWKGKIGSRWIQEPREVVKGVGLSTTIRSLDRNFSDGS